MTVWEGEGREEECSNEVPCRPLVLDGSMVTTLKRGQLDQYQSRLEELEGRWLARKRKRRNALTSSLQGSWALLCC